MKETLIEAAKKARLQAYAPYSRFAVGAALLADGGIIFSGCNVENAVYPTGMCAERVALGNAVTAGQRRFRAVAVVADSPEVCVPCGSCRQALMEFAPDMTVIMANLEGKVKELTLVELLPHAFSAASLGQESDGQAEEREGS